MATDPVLAALKDTQQRLFELSECGLQVLDRESIAAAGPPLGDQGHGAGLVGRPPVVLLAGADVVLALVLAVVPGAGGPAPALAP
ncbi:MAG: hypothetical protein M1337_02320, partial [Actinobacteria bacterium]|nr:hypothetical protein [Actinomycetota bacterium]